MVVFIFFLEWELPCGVLWEPAVAGGGGAVWAADL